LVEELVVPLPDVEVEEFVSANAAASAAAF
jgi:hypothetical protein